jgi:hypothetical protein
MCATKHTRAAPSDPVETSEVHCRRSEARQGFAADRRRHYRTFKRTVLDVVQQIYGSYPKLNYGFDMRQGDSGILIASKNA